MGKIIKNVRVKIVIFSRLCYTYSVAKSAEIYMEVDYEKIKYIK